MKENSIKEDIEEVEKLLCQLKNELYAGTDISYWNANEVYATALERILAEFKRLQMENELMKNEFERLENLEDAIEELILNKTIDISGFECIAVDDLRDLIEELRWIE